MGAKRYEHSAPILKRLNLLNLNEIYIYFVQLFMFKYHHNCISPVFNDMFIVNNSVHEHFTRQQNHLHVPRFSTNLMARSVRVVGVRIYNNFDIFVSINLLYDSYKHNLKHFILKNDISGMM